jgi:flagellar biosynthesis/type III secretory pathway chaperone
MVIFIRGLLKILKQEVSLYKEIIEILQKEREAIISRSPNALLGTNQDKETLLAELESLEEGRQLWVKKLAEELNFSSPKITLSLLAEKLKDPWASQLKSYQQHLSSLINTAVKLNQDNARLLHHSCNAVKQLLTLISSYNRFNPLYLPNGAIQPNRWLGRANQWQV